MAVLFEKRGRTDTGPARQCEPHIDYLERTARPPFALVREQMDLWLSMVPRRHGRELGIRLKNRDDHHFEAAFFELYLHALLRGTGAKTTLHPRAGRGRRPDFLVTSRSGTRFLLEAATVDELSASARASRNRLVAAYDALNEIRCPDFFLNIDHEGEPRTPIPTRRLKREVEAFVHEASYDDVLALASLNRLEALPAIVFEHDGCRISVSLLPVSSARRGAPDHRPVGILGGGGARMVDDRTPIRDKIRAKARSYGRLRRPLVVAINAAGRQLDQIDIMEALFGKETYTFAVGADGRMGEPQLRRQPDGAWVGPRGPTNRRVSAVLFVSSLLPWTVCIHPPRVYHNPWARYPIQGELSELESWLPDAGEMKRRSGKLVNEVLGLTERWPFHVSDAV